MRYEPCRVTRRTLTMTTETVATADQAMAPAANEAMVLVLRSALDLPRLRGGFVARAIRLSTIGLRAVEERVKRLNMMLTIGAVLGAAGCATVTTGNSQKLTVDTDPAGADCTLTQGFTPIGHVNPTPGVITVRRAKDSIRVSCTKAGYQDTEFVNKSGFEAMTVGNVLVGGIVGIAIDAASGANNKYDDTMHIRLAPVAAGQETPPASASTTPASMAPASASPAPAVAPARAAAQVAYVRYESATAEFRCPAAGTLVRTSTNGSLKFTDGSGMTCGYLDQYGAARERYAIFADGASRLAQHDLDALWPLKVGNRVEFLILDSNATTGSEAWRKRDYQESFAVVGKESVTVPAGTFDAFVVEWRETGANTWNQSDAIITSWYAPQVGYVVKSSIKILKRSATDPYADSLYAGLGYEATEVVVPAVSMR